MTKEVFSFIEGLNEAYVIYDFNYNLIASSVGAKKYMNVDFLEKIESDNKKYVKITMMLILEGGDLIFMFTAQAGTIFEKYVHSNKEKRRVGRLIIGKISQKDNHVWSFA